ncbi:hypothetical protein ACFE04_021068 [Oxalis oulophora]
MSVSPPTISFLCRLSSFPSVTHRLPPVPRLSLFVNHSRPLCSHRSLFVNPSCPLYSRQSPGRRLPSVPVSRSFSVPVCSRRLSLFLSFVVSSVFTPSDFVFLVVTPIPVLVPNHSHSRSLVLYRAGLVTAATTFVSASSTAFLPTNFLFTQLLDKDLDFLYMLGAAGLGLSLSLIHIYVTPLKRTLQVFYVLGVIGFNRLVFKEGNNNKGHFCFLLVVVYFVDPVLSSYSDTSCLFHKDDIGDKFMFMFMALSENEKEALIEKVRAAQGQSEE